MAPRKPGRSSWRKLSSALAIGTGAVVLAVLGLSSVLLERAHDSALQVATQSLIQTAQAAVESFDDQIVQVDSVLASLPGIVSLARSASGEVTAETAGRLLRSLNIETFGYRDLLLLHADGTVWAAARSRSPGEPVSFPTSSPGSVSWSSAMAVSGPVKNDLTGERSLFFMRQVVLPTGEPLTAVAELPLRFLVRTLSEAGARPGLRVAVVGPDERLLVTAPFEAASLGDHPRALLGRTPVPGTPFAVREHRRGDPPIAIVETTAYGGVTLLLTLDQSLAMAGWTHQQNRLIGGIAVGILLTIGFAIALAAILRRHERTEQERDEARMILEHAIEAMADGFVIWDQDDRLVMCNARYRELYARIAPFMRPGVRFRDVLDLGVANGQYAEADHRAADFIRDTVAWHRSGAGALERRLPDGRSLMIEDRRTADGCIVGIRTDITALKQAQADLAAANELARTAVRDVRERNLALEERDAALEVQYLRFDAALNNMSHGLLMVDADQKFVVCNRRFFELFGIDAHRAQPGIGASELFGLIGTTGSGDLSIVEELCRRQNELAAQRCSGTFIVQGAEGRAVSVAQQPMEHDGWVATYEDVTQRQHVERQVRFLAHHDPLTRLPNRAFFNLKITEILESLDDARQDDGRSDGCALLYLDLDRFKDVNDTLGHPVGDALLEAVAMRLRRCLGPLDVVARLGGDEFAIACRSLEPAAAAAALSATIIASLGAPFHIADRPVSIGVSIGIALATRTDADADTLLRKADMALYRAKGSGRGVFRVFEPDMESALRKRLDIMGELRAALAGRQFELVYQPIMDLRSGRLAGFEALLRWRHPERGLIEPADFIPLAEETGLIHDIGAWVIDRACRDIVVLPDRVSVAVNLSPVQLRSDRIIEVVSAALAGSGLDAARLELEITETALLGDGAQAAALLGRFRDLGACVVLDDFGTGYSSLSHLRTLPLNKIKIDRSFVREMTTHRDSSAIVRSILGLAMDLGIVTTAEGVETTGQLEAVSGLGCTQAQGYLLGRPKPLLETIATFEEPLRMLPRHSVALSA